MIINTEVLEAINDSVWDKLLGIGHALVTHVIDGLKKSGVDAKAAEKIAKFSVGSAMVQIGSFMNRKIGTEKADVLKMVEEAWEDAEGDPEKPKLRLVTP